MRVAIIGSGVSGLTAARGLHRTHEITVFEAAPYVGGHVNTVDVDLGDERHSIDTGFIVFNEKNYPNFTQLLNDLDVASKPTSMSFSVRCDQTGLEYNGTSINHLFAQRTNFLRPRFYKMVRDILRFNREAAELLAGSGDDLSVADYLETNRYSEAFAEKYLIPLGSSLWSCPAGTFRNFPIRFVIEFLSNHAMMQVDGRPTWRVVAGGSQRYVEKLIVPFENRIRLNTPVKSVQRHANRVRIVDASGVAGDFDHVVFACHSDQALRLLQAPTTKEIELLAAFPYQRNEAVLHMDASVLPKRKLAWAAWNYHIRRDGAEQAAVTYNMNILQGIRSRRMFNVTLNDDDGIDPGLIIRRIIYEHPIFTDRRGEAQQRHGELIGPNRTSYCGAYWGYGFHEDGVRSGLAVCNALDQARAA
ncbi:MAG: FAD-dependent oxidoreductase [Acidobacteria bacterium]|nr:FAD-dependent oxidoreductase [Acidobacteriota bacterium]MDA1236563.1 FAD-dependent oxidoreductase [Acidobacteriota bacterium]